MVAAVSDLNRNVVAIHRTFLDLRGNKTKLDPAKAALGRVTGGAVHLAAVGERLVLAEGIETALSVQQATGFPTWAALGTSNLAKLQVPDCVRELTICADGDGPGERAAQTAAQRLLRGDRVVRIARAPAGTDFNDLLQATAV
ncbi:MAG: toprim domain-containing protein [Candidatus Binatus sp.]